MVEKKVERRQMKRCAPQQGSGVRESHKIQTCKKSANPYDSDISLPRHMTMKETRATHASLNETDTRNLTDFIMFSQRNLILKLSPVLNRGRISYPQFFLLAYLEEEECLSMSSIARIMGHSTAAATGMVDKLEQLGHLRRYTAAADRRKIMVSITDRGRQLVADLRSNIAQDLAQLMAREDERVALKRTNNLLSSARVQKISRIR